MVRMLAVLVVVGGAALAACSAGGSGASSPVASQASATSPQPESSQQQPESQARLVEVPAALALDPCALLTSNDLKELGMATVASMQREAGFNSIPNTGAKAPYVACRWNGTDVTTLGITVFHAPGIERPAEDRKATKVNLGDAGWFLKEATTTSLNVVTGERLMSVKGQLPNYYGSDDNRHLANTWQKASARVDATDTPVPLVKDLPEPVSVCDAITAAPAGSYFTGGVLKLPVGLRVASSAAADADWGNSSGCALVQDNRTLLTAQWLDDTARTFTETTTSRRWKDGTVAGVKARINRETYLVGMGDRGTLAITARNPRDPAALKDAATSIVEALG